GRREQYAPRCAQTGHVLLASCFLSFRVILIVRHCTGQNQGDLEASRESRRHEGFRKALATHLRPGSTGGSGCLLAFRKKRTQLSEARHYQAIGYGKWRFSLPTHGASFPPSDCTPAQRLVGPADVAMRSFGDPFSVSRRDRREIRWTVPGLVATASRPRSAEKQRP